MSGFTVLNVKRKREILMLSRFKLLMDYEEFQRYVKKVQNNQSQFIKVPVETVKNKNYLMKKVGCC